MNPSYINQVSYCGAPAFAPWSEFKLYHFDLFCREWHPSMFKEPMAIGRPASSCKGVAWRYLTTAHDWTNLHLRTSPHLTGWGSYYIYVHVHICKVCWFPSTAKTESLLPPKPLLVDDWFMTYRILVANLSSKAPWTSPRRSLGQGPPPRRYLKHLEETSTAWGPSSTLCTSSCFIM